MKPTLQKLFLPLMAALALAACEPADGPFVEMTGGGFQFNYRIAEATYTMVATSRRKVPEGTLFVAEFEDPSNPLPDGAPLVAELVSRAGQTRFALSSPPVTGVVADRDYTVVLTLKAADGSLIETHRKTYSSKIGSEVLPSRPLTIGPGYTPNPDASVDADTAPE